MKNYYVRYISLYNNNNNNNNNNNSNNSDNDNDNNNNNKLIMIMIMIIILQFAMDFQIWTEAEHILLLLRVRLAAQES